LLCDVRMPGMSGLELHRRLRDHAILLPVIIITGHGDIPMAVRAMREGALDFLEKPLNDQLLLDRVHEAFRIDKERRRQEERHAAIRQALDSLTAREKEVLDLVAAGLPNKVAAVRLQVSPKTIEFHRAKIMEKLKARNLAELLRTFYCHFQYSDRLTDHELHAL